MAGMDWGAMQRQFLAEHAKSGISPKDWCKLQGLNYATARRYIKKKTKNAQTEMRKSAQKKSAQTAHSHSEKKPKASNDKGSAKNCANLPETKRNNRSGNPSPHNQFQPNNQVSLKHGGYGRRMLLSDATTEDARTLKLEDELFWLRAANLTAAENVGRWRAMLDDANNDEARKLLLDNIGAAEKAMHRNTARIESLEYTRSSIAKLRVDAAYREATTEKVKLEIDIMRDGDKDNAIVVHNSLPVPGK